MPRAREGPDAPRMDRSFCKMPVAFLQPVRRTRVSLDAAKNERCTFDYRIVRRITSDLKPNRQVIIASSRRVARAFAVNASRRSLVNGRVVCGAPFINDCIGRRAKSGLRAARKYPATFSGRFSLHHGSPGTDIKSERTFAYLAMQA